MIKTKTPSLTKPTIDLDGPDGNAYALLAHARKFSNINGYDFDQVRDEMTSGDYENLIRVFDKYFGEFIDLERTK